MKKIILLIFLLIAFTSLQAQQLSVVEKTYEITGKAKRGTLVDVKYDQASGQYALYYVVKSSPKAIILQIYKFDKDFNFIEIKEEEVEIAQLNQKKILNPFDFSWVNYRGETYIVEGNTVEGNLVGTLVLKKKRISYIYNWFTLDYNVKVDILEKVKPKNDEGSKFYYFTHFEDDNSGDLYVLCGARDGKKGSDPFKYHREMHVLKFNKDLDILKDVTIPFENYNGYMYAKAVTKTAEDNVSGIVSKLIFVFAPYDFGKTYKDPDNCNYRYVSLDSDLKILDNLPVKSNASYWNIDYILATDEAVYVFGPAAAGKDKHANLLKGQVKKFKSVQLMKVANGKIEYLTETNLEEFAAKLKTPPSQKKTPEYEGMKFDIMNYEVFPNGDFIVVGQNFRVDPNNETKYLDIIAFHFDAKGVLKAQYGVDTRESNEYSKKYGTPQSMILGLNNNNMYWVVQEIKGFSDFFNKILTYPRIAKVDLAAGTLGDFSVFGDGDYFLDPKFPYLETEPGNIVFFGANKPGKIIWFAKVKLE